jgi:hypothetical protein
METHLISGRTPVSARDPFRPICGPKVPPRSLTSHLIIFPKPNLMDPDTKPPPSQPSLLNYTLGFLLVGIAWGFTTPFIRRAAVNYSAPNPSTYPSTADPKRSWLSRKIALAFWTVVGLLRKPEYAVPLLVNLTGSIWFFLLVGKAGMCTILR